MDVLSLLREDQIPLLAALLLTGCSAKLARAARRGSMDDGLSPTTLFPVRMRQPLALATCVVEGVLGAGLIITAGKVGRGVPADLIRLCTILLFAVATCALLELRAVRPDVGCGCFGDFSAAPVSSRTVARSALLGVAAFGTFHLRPINTPDPGQAIVLVVIMIAELVVLAALSPEVGEALISLGYSEPCELRALPADRTLTALRRSKQWRRHARLLLTDKPADVWRELCWRYVVFPARCPGRSCDVVFAIFLRHRRPAVHAALVDALTGEPLPWPVAQRERGRLRLRRPAPAAPTNGALTNGTLTNGVLTNDVLANGALANGALTTQTTPARLDMPVSSDL